MSMNWVNGEAHRTEGGAGPPRESAGGAPGRDIPAGREYRGREGGNRRKASRRDRRPQGGPLVLALVVAGQLPWASTRGDLSRTVAALELLGTLVSLVIWVPAEKRMGVATGLGLLVCSTNHQVIDFSSDKKLVTSYPMGAD